VTRSLARRVTDSLDYELRVARPSLIMTQINSILSQIGLFFKDAAVSIPQVFNWKFLTTPPTGSSKYGLVYIIILAVIIVGGLALQMITERRTYPKFYKKFLSRVGGFLIYMPTLLIFLQFIKISKINALTSPIYPVAIIAIWLIWFLYLIYYRIVIVRKFWTKYEDYKRQEKYLKYAKASR